MKIAKNWLVKIIWPFYAVNVLIVIQQTSKFQITIQKIQKKYVKFLVFAKSNLELYALVNLVDDLFALITVILYATIAVLCTFLL